MHSPFCGDLQAGDEIYDTAPIWITHDSENTAAHAEVGLVATDFKLPETRPSKQDINFDHTLVCAIILIYINVEHAQIKYRVHACAIDWMPDRREASRHYFIFGGSR